MTDDSGDSREQGIEFGPLAEELEEEQYPLTHDDLLDRHGDRVLELVDGSATLREVLAPGDEGENEREYEDEESVRNAVFSMVGDGAIGREDYTDRGGDGAEMEATEETDSI